MTNDKLTLPNKPTSQSDNPLPPVIAGPILRRLEADRLVIWMALTRPSHIRLTLQPETADEKTYTLNPGSDALRIVTIGEHLHLALIDLKLTKALPQDHWIAYDIAVAKGKTARAWSNWQDWAPDLVYPGQKSPGFKISSQVRSLYQGSCRKPHHTAGDGLVDADALLQASLEAKDQKAKEANPWPAFLIMSGDQIYGDDVAGPMLVAIHHLIARLGIPTESFESLNVANLPDSHALQDHPKNYYGRDELLPDIEASKRLIDYLFGGKSKPIFTTDSAHNHLISFAEYLVMYLLVWSPTPWTLIDIETPRDLTPKDRALFETETDVIADFVTGLPAARRLFAHLSVAMIFDDHDLTDDWNLHRGWEEAVYGHPFTHRIMGNGLLAYMLCQGWGNHPDGFEPDLMNRLRAIATEPGNDTFEDLLNDLIGFECWDYAWETDPPLIVLDTRTRRWRSESSATKPSGLLDWEALTDLQRGLRGRDKVLLVSASPIFGVKLIEVIQRFFTVIGKPLLVDAENWMAHPGTANGILNVFRHSKTPENFVVLSGDVHYSFVYDVELKGQSGGPNIWQICSSGLRNEFPPKLLDVLDRLNSWAFAPKSPLNWFTRRRRMRIVPRRPAQAASGRRLLNRSGIGVVDIDAEGRPWRIRHVAGGKAYDFERLESEQTWE